MSKSIAFLVFEVYWLAVSRQPSGVASHICPVKQIGGANQR